MADALMAALYSIPADDRETWYRMGAAIKTELGEAGFALWDAWSRTSDRYNARAAASTWRSLKPGKVTIGSLYHLAKEYGWGGEQPVRRQPTRAELDRQERDRARKTQREEQRAREAAGMAQAIINRAEFAGHPYLTRKGFPEKGGLVADGLFLDYRRRELLPLVERPPDHPGLVLDGMLVIPMRHFIRYEVVQSVQLIDAQGEKKFLPGGRAGEAVYRMGKGERWYVEGFATGLSVAKALQRLYRKAEVVVCFSAANIPKVARSTRLGFVVADHDKPDKQGRRAGEHYAKQAGHPYWVPPDEGTDANDYHLEHGLDALADALRRLA